MNSRKLLAKRFFIGGLGLSYLTGCPPRETSTPTPAPDYIAEIRAYSNFTHGGIVLNSNDFDGDGDIDVIAASSYDGKIYLFLNDGNANFTLHRPTTAEER